MVMHAYTCKVRTGLLMALSLCLPAAMFAAESSFDRTLSVNGPVTLQVSTGSGYIHISSGPGNQVHVIGHVKASSAGRWLGVDPDDAVAKVSAAPPIDQAGNIIRIGNRREDDLFRRVSIDYEITAPRGALLSAQTGSGDIQLSDLNGTVKAQTGSGDIHATRLGAGSKLETGSGTIEANDLAGSSILQTGSGDIRAQFSAAGDVTAGTGSGSVQLRNVQGALKVQTGSGDLDITGQPASPWKLETGSGSITLGVGNAHFTLDAETGSGSVKSDLPIAMQGSLNKHHITGTLNGGGPTVKAQTGSGDIRIH